MNSMTAVKSRATSAAEKEKVRYATYILPLYSSGTDYTNGLNVEIIFLGITSS